MMSTAALRRSFDFARAERLLRIADTAGIVEILDNVFERRSTLRGNTKKRKNFFAALRYWRGERRRDKFDASEFRVLQRLKQLDWQCADEALLDAVIDAGDEQAAKRLNLTVEHFFEHLRRGSCKEQHATFVLRLLAVQPRCGPKLRYAHLIDLRQMLPQAVESYYKCLIAHEWHDAILCTRGQALSVKSPFVFHYVLSRWDTLPPLSDRFIFTDQWQWPAIVSNVKALWKSLAAALAPMELPVYIMTRLCDSYFPHDFQRWLPQGKAHIVDWGGEAPSTAYGVSLSSRIKMANGLRASYARVPHNRELRAQIDAKAAKRAKNGE